MISPLEALMTGHVLGLLIYQRENALSFLTPKPIMNGDDYTNVIEMTDEEGRVRVTITVEEVESA